MLRGGRGLAALVKTLAGLLFQLSDQRLVRCGLAGGGVLVAAAHRTFLALDQSADLVSTALGLSATGRDGLLCYQELVYALIDAAVHPETAQTVYGLALLLERGTLFAPPMAPALWRQLNLELCPEAEAAILRAQGEAVPARVRLLADVLGVL
ncbi:MAG: hypothetical protein CL810_11580, partial [Cobetia sp.]|nr:hypothetical protein [Cobetia sp.]